uniref:hypothetical protein n=1 Tax=Streptococcus pluranimalium TaxID=82348 RepID=UPI003F6935A9
MKNNPSRSERREIERLRAIGVSGNSRNLFKNKKISGQKEFILNTYFKITIVPLIFIVIIYFMSFSVKSIVFLGNTGDLVATLFGICLGLTASFTGALIMCEPFPYYENGYKSIVKAVTIVIFVVFLIMVANN